MPSTRCFSGAIAVVLLAVLSLALSGCARPIPADEMGFTHPVQTSDGMYLVERPGPGVLFLARSPLALERYNHFIVEEIRLGFREGFPDFIPSEHEKATALVRRNVLRRLSLHGWQPATDPGPDTLRMRIAITEIDYQPRALQGGDSLVVTASGGAKMTVELRDSSNNRRLLIYAQHRELTYAVYAGPRRIEAERLADTFIEYSEDLARCLAQIEGGNFPAPRPHARNSPSD